MPAPLNQPGQPQMGQSPAIPYAGPLMNQAARNPNPATSLSPNIAGADNNTMQQAAQQAQAEAQPQGLPAGSNPQTQAPANTQVPMQNQVNATNVPLAPPMNAQPAIDPALANQDPTQMQIPPEMQPEMLANVQPQTMPEQGEFGDDLKFDHMVTTASDIFDRAGKWAAQDNSAPQRSYLGQSNGLSYNVQDDDNSTGSQALKSLDRFSRSENHGKYASMTGLGDPPPELGEEHAENAIKDMADGPDKRPKSRGKCMKVVAQFSKQSLDTSFVPSGVKTKVRDHAKGRNTPGRFDKIRHKQADADFSNAARSTADFDEFEGLEPKVDFKTEQGPTSSTFKPGKPGESAKAWENFKYKYACIQQTDSSPIAKSFIAECVKRGMDCGDIKSGINKLAQEFDDSLIAELNDGLNKCAGVLGWGARGLGKLFGSGAAKSVGTAAKGMSSAATKGMSSAATKGVNTAAKGMGGATQSALGAAKQRGAQAAKSMVGPTAKNIGQGVKGTFGGAFRGSAMGSGAGLGADTAEWAAGGDFDFDKTLLGGNIGLGAGAAAGSPWARRMAGRWAGQGGGKGMAGSALKAFNKPGKRMGQLTRAGVGAELAPVAGAVGSDALSGVVEQQGNAFIDNKAIEMGLADPNMTYSQWLQDSGLPPEQVQQYLNEQGISPDTPVPPQIQLQGQMSAARNMLEQAGPLVQAADSVIQNNPKAGEFLQRLQNGEKLDAVATDYVIDAIKDNPEMIDEIAEATGMNPTSAVMGFVDKAFDSVGSMFGFDGLSQQMAPWQKILTIVGILGMLGGGTMGMMGGQGGLPMGMLGLGAAGAGLIPALMGGGNQQQGQITQNAQQQAQQAAGRAGNPYEQFLPGGSASNIPMPDTNTIQQLSNQPMNMNNYGQQQSGPLNLNSGGGNTQFTPGVFD